MTHVHHITKTMINLTCGVALVIGLTASSAFAQQTLSPEELKAHIEKQQAALDAAIANRDKTQRELEAKRMAYEAQQAKQLEIEEKMKALCEEQEAIKPGSMDDCMGGKK